MHHRCTTCCATYTKNLIFAISHCNNSKSLEAKEDANHLIWSCCIEHREVCMFDLSFQDIGAAHATWDKTNFRKRSWTGPSLRWSNCFCMISWYLSMIYLCVADFWCISRLQAWSWLCVFFSSYHVRQACSNQLCTSCVVAAWYSVTAAKPVALICNNYATINSNGDRWLALWFDGSHDCGTHCAFSSGL